MTDANHSTHNNTSQPTKFSWVVTNKKQVLFIISLLLVLSVHFIYMFMATNKTTTTYDKTLHISKFLPTLTKISLFFRKYAFSDHPLNFLNYRKTVPHSHPFATDYYLDTQNSMRRLTLEIMDKNVYNPRVVIVSQLFGRNRQSDHYHDMLTCVQINLLNPFIAEYHFLQEDEFNNEDLMNLINAKEKIKISILGRRLMSADFMEYCNEHLKDRIVMLTNTDIYFDHTLVHASKMNYDTSLMLSRKQTFITDYLEGQNRDHCVGGYVGSHDVFMFRTERPFPQDAITQLRKVPLGYYGSENVIMHYAANNKDFKYKIKNACETIWVWHLHDKREGGGPVPRINDDTNTGMMGPGDAIN